MSDAAATPGDDRSWKIGSLQYSEGTWHMGGGRAIDDQQVADLKAKAAFVRELAEQESFHRFISCGRRWQGILKKAEKELEEDGELSTRTQQTARDEVVTTVRLARSVEGDLADDLDGRLGADDPALHRFRAVRDRLRSSRPMLLFANLSGDSEGNVLEQTDVGISFREVHSVPAWEVIVAVTGVLAGLVRAHLEALREQFRPIYDEFERIAEEVQDGAPTLTRLKIDEQTDSVTGFETMGLPILESRAIRHVLNFRSAGIPPVTHVHAMASTLAEARHEQQVVIGATEAHHAMVGGDLHEGLEALSSARIDFDPELLGSTPIDYWAPVTFTFEQGPHRQERLKGSVRTAVVEGGIVHAEVEDAADLTEHSAQGMVVEGMTPAEVVSALVRQAGLPPETVRIENPPAEGEEEDFEVLLPVQGIRVRAEVSVGSDSLVPLSDGEAAVSSMSFDPADARASRLLDEFRRADSYLRAVVLAREIDLAEDQGIARAETAMAWLVTRGRYGELNLPDGEVQEFSRESSLRSPGLGRVVLVKGRRTERRWLRWPSPSGDPAERVLEAGSPGLRPDLPDSVSASDRQALLALWRAARDADPLSQIQAIWQAIETYTAGTSARHVLFPSSDRKRFRDRLGGDWNDEQLAKLDWVLGMLNDPPVNVRLEWRLRRDGVRITDDELELLQRLRKSRNAIVHGREVSSPPSREDVNRGIGLVSRMLVHRIARLSNQGTESDS